MRTIEELARKLESYAEVSYIWREDLGYIVWRNGTGDNLEFLFIEVVEQGKGKGVELYRLMAKKILEDGKRPYHSIYGFRLTGNTKAGKFYQKMGWHQVDFGQAIYGGDKTTLMWMEWNEFLTKIGLKD